MAKFARKHQRIASRTRNLAFEGVLSHASLLKTACGGSPKCGENEGILLPGMQRLSWFCQFSNARAFPTPASAARNA